MRNRLNFLNLTALYLNMIFSDRVPHEHGVEGGHLINSHPGHANDLCHMMHARDWQPASVLSLGKIKKGNNLEKNLI